MAANPGHAGWRHGGGGGGGSWFYHDGGAGGAGGDPLVIISYEPITQAPEITSSLHVSVEVGRQFSYTITANRNPLSFDTSHLPPWLTFESPRIHGIPIDADTYAFDIEATNHIGTTTETLIIDVVEQPLGEGTMSIYV
jgi:hypothetical protein